ncbi:MAG: recombinase family protein [Agathobaculum sp.]|jgi:site-specific DNA recombinase|uniref:recombinase family protein n=1 Tax=Agathobaculum sp. TaxID=2048138 RepID=UPI003D8FE324
MRFCAYGRVSTLHTEQLDSLENQKKFFEDFARRQGWELVRIYADEGISGKQLRRREQFNQMLKDAETGAFEMVVVKDITRFARNTVDFLTAIRHLRALDVTVQFVTNNMSSLGDSEFILTVFGALAQEESANLSRRIAFGKKINAQKGRVPNRIYGYDHIDNYTLQINETEAAIVRQIFTWYLSGWGCRRIAETLNDRAVPTCTGTGAWHERGIRKMLSYDLYQGLLCNHRSVTKNFLTGDRRALPPAEWFRHARPELALISPVQFDAVQMEKQRRSRGGKQEERKRSTLRRQNQSEKAHLFSTIFICGLCKSSMVRKVSRRTDGSMREYWVCCRHDQGRLLREGPLAGRRCSGAGAFEECDLYTAIRAFLDCFDGLRHKPSAQFLGEIERRMQQEGDTASLERLRRAQKKEREKRSRLVELYMQGGLTESELHEQLADAKARERTLQQEMQAAGRRQKAMPSITQVQQAIQACLSLYAVTNADLHEIFDRIELSDDRQATFYLRGIEKAAFQIAVPDSRRNKIARCREKKKAGGADNHAPAYESGND